MCSKVANTGICSMAFILLAIGMHLFMAEDIVDDYLEGLGSMGSGSIGWSARQEFS